MEGYEKGEKGRGKKVFSKGGKNHDKKWKSRDLEAKLVVELILSWNVSLANGSIDNLREQRKESENES